MNKLLVAIFDNEFSAGAGLKALQVLHASGDITLYATSVVARGADGVVAVMKSPDASPVGAVTGLAVGSLVGLLGGPTGMVIGAVTGSIAGAVRDFWMAGVGLDFIEEVTRQLRPGKVALVAEMEEEWVIPVDTALEAAGAQVFRRTRAEVSEAQFDHDIAAFKSDIEELEAESSQASGAAKTRLQARLATAKTALDSAVHRAQQRVESLKKEADAKAEAVGLQMSQAKDDVRHRLEERMQRVRKSYHARGSKLAHAWSLTKEALLV